MKKTHKRSVPVAGLVWCLLSLGACSDFLDVQPEDEFLASHVFSSEEATREFFNGIYVSMRFDRLYGGDLTMSTVEVIGQQYDWKLAGGSDLTGEWAVLGQYDYSEPKARSRIDGIWSEAYRTIVNISDFIENIDAYPGVMPDHKAGLLKGEALGLRAFIHFDLLRLFGPIYRRNPGGRAIPYLSRADAQVNDLLPASDVIDRVLKDLEDAEELLAQDPVVAQGVLRSPAPQGQDGFYRYRNERFNYYAVKALQARVHLYAGNTAGALAAAQVVIDANMANGRFPWTDPKDIFADGNPDRIFSSEVIFGLHNTALSSSHNNYFSQGRYLQRLLLTAQILRVGSVYENNINDYRYNAWWIASENSAYPGRVFHKFSGAEMQPLIRLSEMYYIAAETHPDPAEGRAYLNTVRAKRGLTALPIGVDLQAEIQKEYRKEFCGEGQMFFYYKRRAMTGIPDGTSAYGTRSAHSAQYVLPLPDLEIEFRN